MSSAPPPVERFTGTNWEECNEFIIAIRARALWEGKQRDPAWMADFAATFFYHQALSWHCRLPEDVRQNWSKLEIALVDRWPPPEHNDEPQIYPTPAAAPFDRNRIEDPPRQGSLRVLLDQPNATYYVSFSGYLCTLTSNASEAIRVRCDSSSGTTLLEPIVRDRSSPSRLAVQWASSKPNLGAGSSDFACLTFVDPVSLKSSWADDSPFQLNTYTFSDDGELLLVWNKDDASSTSVPPCFQCHQPPPPTNRHLSQEIRIFAMAFDGILVLVADAGAFARNHNGAKRVKLFIEATD